jgi:hypothetical protein
MPEASSGPPPSRDAEGEGPAVAPRHPDQVASHDVPQAPEVRVAMPIALGAWDRAPAHQLGTVPPDAPSHAAYAATLRRTREDGFANLASG